MEVYITGQLPKNQRHARPPLPEKRRMILEKIIKVLKRGYVVLPDVLNYIKSLIDYFEVPNDLDIRLVYNGMSCGLNEVFYLPNFRLPTPASVA
jgi:hypothetical protein